MAASSAPPPPVFPPVLPGRHPHAPAAKDLDKCVHCGLCLNACPTYRELGLEMDSPRGRIYQMVQIATGQAQIDDTYREHIDLCLACRACETACPSGVPYGRLVEAARAEIRASQPETGRGASLQRFLYNKLLPSRGLLKTAGALLYLAEVSGLRKLARNTGLLKAISPKLAEIEPLAPSPEAPFFFSKIGKTFPAIGPKRARVALMAGCIANVFFARLNEATIRVLQRNGCEVVIPAKQTCCGALHVHAGVRDTAQELARQNIAALLEGKYDAIITNAAGCGSTLKEYPEIAGHDPAWEGKAIAFSALVRDVNEFLAGLGLNKNMGALDLTVTYQDSCHLAHGQRVKVAPRRLLAAIPGVTFREMPLSDLCCGSAGVYNIVHVEMAANLLAKKMPLANGTRADVIATANPGCMLQLRAGVQRHGRGQRVVHVIELLDEAYAKLES